MPVKSHKCKLMEICWISCIGSDTRLIQSSKYTLNPLLEQACYTAMLQAATTKKTIYTWQPVNIFLLFNCLFISHSHWRSRLLALAWRWVQYLDEWHHKTGFYGCTINMSDTLCSERCTYSVWGAENLSSMIHGSSHCLYLEYLFWCLKIQFVMQTFVQMNRSLQNWHMMCSIFQLECRECSWVEIKYAQDWRLLVGKILFFSHHD